MTVRLTAKVTVKDKGLKALFAQANALGINGTVDVGLIDADPNVIKIGRIHEFGAPAANIPSRSYLRATLHSDQARYSAMERDLLKRVLKGDISQDEALKALGQELVNDVKKAIMRGIPPPLKDATIAAKSRAGFARSTTALYRTGALYNSIKYRLSTGGA